MLSGENSRLMGALRSELNQLRVRLSKVERGGGAGSPGGSGDAVTSGNLDQFAGVVQTGGTTLTISGTTTVSLLIRSASAVATQTCRLHRFVVSKYTPT
jgi:hypothetical protein